MKAKKFLTCLIALSVLVFGLQGTALATDKHSTKQATEFRVNNKVLKTKPARAGEIAPLFDALEALDAGLVRKDHSPKDAHKRLQKINVLAAKAKREISSLAWRLKQTNEVEDFNAFIAAKMSESKSETLSAELKDAGGDAHAILANAPAYIDKLIAERAELINKQGANMRPGFLHANSAGVSHWFAVTNMKPNAPTLRPAFGTGCSIFFFVVTAGYGTELNYRFCMRSRAA